MVESYNFFRYDKTNCMSYVVEYKYFSKLIDEIQVESYFRRINFSDDVFYGMGK